MRTKRKAKTPLGPLGGPVKRFFFRKSVDVIARTPRRLQASRVITSETGRGG
jgi:hypothetical protein